MNKYHQLVIGLIIIISSCTVELSSDNEEDILRQSLEKFNNAFETCDIVTLAQLTTANYLHINGNQPSITKKDWMEYLKKRKKQLEDNQLNVTKYVFEEDKITFYGQSAFVTGVIFMDGSRDGIDFSRKIRVSHFWVKDNDQWKRAGFHDVRIE